MRVVNTAILSHPANWLTLLAWLLVIAWGVHIISPKILTTPAAPGRSG